MGELSLAMLVIIGVNVLISFKGFSDQAFFNKYKFNVADIKGGAKYQILTSGFLHVDTSHLFVNMLTLYFFANVVIYGIGTTAFLLIYIGSLLFGNLVSYFFHKKDYQYTAVGASGAVMGILYSAILLQPDMTLGLFFVIPVPAYVFGIGYLFYTIYGMKRRTDNIGHDAHFGGATGGYFLTMLLAPWVFESHLLMVALLAIPIVILFLLQRTGYI
ncbi:rhomboid family intramembrane serine protease [Christiangramia forsetii]|uniref:Rhomboid family protein n=2 Tax=Christiangramia forsetii TaxID=411153 RepID=A0M324_CHRFK|nr:rhomboid family intramembrane serine protease [Christiangramia forsetii]GGG26973.1 rhomboid family intramembrane serine protease [Christiangramia forsetii]CAL67019.1 rhomboid family protein [Christiangramia forsetii KT0803]